MRRYLMVMLLLGLFQGPALASSEYVSESKLFKMSIPSGWQVKEEPGKVTISAGKAMDINVKYAPNPYANAGPDVKASIFEKETARLDKFLHSAYEVHYSKNGPAELGSKPAYRWDYRLVQVSDYLSMKQVTLLTFHAGQAVQINAAYVEGEQNPADLEAFLGGFQFIEPTP